MGKNKKESVKMSTSGWNTTDADEILRRQIRANAENMTVLPMDRANIYYGSFLTSSENCPLPEVSKYWVEIRSLEEPINSCNCLDYQVNGLGTCKHIEKVLLKLRKYGKRKFAEALKNGSPRAELFIDRRDQALKANTVSILWPKSFPRNSQTFRSLDAFFSNNGLLLDDPIKAIPLLKSAIQSLPLGERNKIRFSSHIDSEWDALQREQHQKDLQRDFLEDIRIGKRHWDFLKCPLYPYQQQGVLHLVSQRRALLADEMGLGKTAQAIGACVLLQQLEKITHVLIVTTASLKAEWEEQITKFSDLNCCIVQGSRLDRLKQYQSSAFFYIVNYEQVLLDGPDIQRLLSPDIVILDEAQRIKNWHTKTAAAIKRLNSPYAFVLTGTPLENRIDDIYSVVQFLNPRLFGPLFKFNREFYQLDENGKPVGYKNLDELHRRLKPILLRRKKSDVEEQLPERTIKHYFVAMNDEQQKVYMEYEKSVGRLLIKAKKRPLLKEEHERLQQLLACMRMVCDSPYILDPDYRESPKIDELEKILEEIMVDPLAKIIIFSEWEKMLQLVHMSIQKKQLQVAWHTGSVSQQKRRVEIKRFKEDPNCRFFLSTDAGSVGLNMQNANVVINMDLPWNPARLEQRIARAWRKLQTRTVKVINLVCENSIEHRMISLLNQKSELATTILHGGHIKEMQMPSGRAAFIERLEALLGPKIPQETGVSKEIPRTQDKPSILPELLDKKTVDILKQLLKVGAISIKDEFAASFEKLGVQPVQPMQKPVVDSRIAESRELLQPVERKYQMAKLLAEGEFLAEALIPMQEVVRRAVVIFAYVHHWLDDLKKQDFSLELKNELSQGNRVSHDLLERSWAINNMKTVDDSIEVKGLLETCQELLAFVKGEGQ